MFKSKLSLVLVAGALAVAPSLASADVVIENPPQPQPPPPAPAPTPAPTTTTTTVVTPTPTPAPTTAPTTTTTTTPTTTTTVVTPAPAPAPTNTTTIVTPASMANGDVGVTATETETDYINAPVFTTGATVFALSYGAGVITAASTSTKSNDRLYVPLVGPWLALHDRIKDNNCGDLSNASCDTNTTAKVLLVVDGVFQAAGLLAMLDGVFDPGTHEVHHTATVAKNSKKVHIAPAPVGNGDPGIWAMGRF